MKNLYPLFLSAMIALSPAVVANQGPSVARDITDCRKLRSSEARLACFDAVADRLAEELLLADDGRETTESLEPKEEDEKASEPPSTTSGGELPTWAAGPQRSQEKRDLDSRQFEAIIVRITRTNRGRHRFYTEDGAIWEQTQTVDFVPPRSLPTVAEFRRRMTGNPTIRFDVSRRSYRVRRIE